MSIDRQFEKTRVVPSEIKGSKTCTFPEIYSRRAVALSLSEERELVTFPESCSDIPPRFLKYHDTRSGIIVLVNTRVPPATNYFPENRNDEWKVSNLSCKAAL
jgi:hypothetical protein